MSEKSVRKSSIVAIIALILMLVSATYAFFKSTDAINTDIPFRVTTNTTDSLIFNVDNDISFTASPANFNKGMGNQEGSANASAVLKANNKTNTATEQYYLYLDIRTNTFDYVTEDNTAELLLQVSGPDGALGNGDILGLDYVTVTDGNGEQVSGFDITEVQDLITIANNRKITTTSEKTDSWNIKVIFVNLESDQAANGGKKFNASIIIQKSEYVYPLLAHYIKTNVYTGVQGENNIYYHKDLTNSAEDGSYRYAGSYEEVENYVCFGSYEKSCPYDNLYRIIGVFGDQVKLIKADYAKSTLLGTSGDYKSSYYDSQGRSNWGTNKGSNTKEEIGGYYWNYSNTTSSKNIWAQSGLNKENLNGTYLNGLGITWQSKIAMTTWKVGGNTDANIRVTTAAVSYQNEILNPVSGQTAVTNKIGLMYVSDYGFAAEPSAWTTKLNSYNPENIPNKNWMYGGLWEWTISRNSAYDYRAFNVGYGGSVEGSSVISDGYAVRPVFYLESDVELAGGDGTKNSPYRIKTEGVVSDKVRVIATWKGVIDPNNRPYVTANLIGNGDLDSIYDTVSLEDFNNWSYIWTELPLDYVWTVSAAAIEGYDITIEQVGVTFVITYTYINDDNPDNPVPPDEPDVPPDEPPI